MWPSAQVTTCADRVLALHSSLGVVHSPQSRSVSGYAPEPVCSAHVLAHVSDGFAT